MNAAKYYETNDIIVDSRPLLHHQNQYQSSSFLKGKNIELGGQVTYTEPDDMPGPGSLNQSSDYLQNQLSSNKLKLGVGNPFKKKNSISPDNNKAQIPLNLRLKLTQVRKSFDLANMQIFDNPSASEGSFPYIPHKQNN